MEKTQENLGKLETQLKQWGARLDELVAKADRAGTTARIDNRRRIDDLNAKVQAARSALARYHSAMTPYATASLRSQVREAIEAARRQVAFRDSIRQRELEQNGGSAGGGRDNDGHYC